MNRQVLFPQLVSETKAKHRLHIEHMLNETAQEEKYTNAQRID
jgi:hypothetical protein